MSMPSWWPALGLALWTMVLAALRLRGPLDEYALAQLLMTFGPLVTVPLGLSLTPARSDAAESRRLRWLFPPLALGALGLAAVALQDPGPALRIGLSAPYLLFTALAALHALLRLIERRSLALPELVIDVAIGCLAIAGMWLLVANAGLALGGFGGLWAMLTAAHFHFAGFGALLHLGLLGRARAAAGRPAGPYTPLAGGLLLFVDDDNLLAPDYLATGLALADADPRLACWGGQLLPEYEVPPPEWFGPFARYLAVFPLAADRVVEAFTGNHDCLPPTAGMFVRRETLRYHQQLVAAEPLRLVLGGRGGLRIGGEDTDLALAALEAGGRVGRFAGLRLVHLIPAGRLTLAYLEGLIQGIRTGTVLVHHLRGRPAPPAPGPLLRLRQRWQLWRLPEVSRRLCAAEWRGEAVARHLIATTHR